MKKNLLALGALAVAFSMNMDAKNMFYAPSVDMFDGTATVRGVSKNGEFVVVNDEDNVKSYLWSLADPENWKEIPTNNPNLKGVNVSGVSNDGKILVGTVILINAGNANSRPAVCIDGIWRNLPTHEALVNTVEVMGCNSDASIIFGYQFLNDPTSEINGRYYPCTWHKNASGEYDLKTYDNLPLPEHQGFIPWAMNEKGNIIAGTLNVPAGSTIPSFILDGELVYFEELETRLEPFYYKGQIHGYYENYYINGYNDGITGEYFSGSFTGLDAWGNFYGYRTRAYDVITDPEDNHYGEGVLENGACVYNLEKGEWNDYNNIQAFSTGLNREYMFTNAGTVANLEGSTTTLANEFEVDPAGLVNPSITYTSADGKTLAGVHTVFNPAINENDYFPFVIVLDEPLVVLPEPTPDVPDTPQGAVFEIVNGGEGVNIVLTNGRIDVAGVETAVLYDLNGRQIANGTTFHVKPGVYVVATAAGSHKVMVK